MEDMHDDIACIHQYPITAFLPFDRNAFISRFFECFDDIVRKRTHMTRRSTACNNHTIGKIGFAGQINADNVFGFVCVKRRKYETFKLRKCDLWKQRFGSYGRFSLSSRCFSSIPCNSYIMPQKSTVSKHFSQVRRGKRLPGHR